MRPAISTPNSKEGPLYPKLTATAKVCEILKAGNLPRTRTTGNASYTRQYRTKKGWWNPANARQRRKP